MELGPHSASTRDLHEELLHDDTRHARDGDYPDGPAGCSYDEGPLLEDTCAACRVANECTDRDGTDCWDVQSLTNGRVVDWEL